MWSCTPAWTEQRIATRSAVCRRSRGPRPRALQLQRGQSVVEPADRIVVDEHGEASGVRHELIEARTRVTLLDEERTVDGWAGVAHRVGPARPLRRDSTRLRSTPCALAPRAPVSGSARRGRTRTHTTASSRRPRTPAGDGGSAMVAVGGPTGGRRSGSRRLVPNRARVHACRVVGELVRVDVPATQVADSAGKRGGGNRLITGLRRGELDRLGRLTRWSKDRLGAEGDTR